MRLTRKAKPANRNADISYIKVTDMIVHAKESYISEQLKRGEISGSFRISVCLFNFESMMFTEECIWAYQIERFERYLISEAEYRRLFRRGFLCCRAIEVSVFNRFIENGVIDPEILIGQYGYSVANKGGLLQRERQLLLAFLIENEIFSSDDICDQLNNLIVSFGALKNRRRSAARWKKDFDYVRSYEYGNDYLIVGEQYRKEISDTRKTLLERSGIRIQAEDFVIKEYVFRCIYEGHTVRDIDAYINIIRDDGVLEEKVIPAGWCKDCGTFFILESTFQELLCAGTPVCRVTTENYYRKQLAGKNSNLKMLAEKSILRECGYTVSEKEGLSETRRRAILAFMIDNGILEKSRVISYLDYHIYLRKNVDGMENAISKWKSDRIFISGYKIGSYKAVGVTGLRIQI